LPRDGVAVVRIWQANIGKTIIAHVPMTNGEVQETGDFELDGVTFPAAEVQLDSWTRQPKKRAQAARCSRPANWWTIWKCPASARSRRP
jgi:2-methylaconitate cis-trans-isomerase PrpF